MAKKRNGRSPGGDSFGSSGAARGARKRGHSAPAGRGPAKREAHVTPNRRLGFSGGERPYDYSFYESEPATPEYMGRLFAKHSFPVTPDQLRKFWIYYDLLRRWNASLDLTRIMGIEATVLKHFVDSAMILQWYEPKGPVLDIGSGPGFPGVPLAVMRPDCDFILAESRGKRVGFLRDVVAALELRNATVFPRSIREDSPLGEEHGCPVGDVVTRALETIPPTLERILPFLPPGGRAVFLKGPGCDDEIQSAGEAFPGVYRLALDRQYLLPDTDQGRRLIIYERLAIEK